jgi:predicted transcriptional regulator
MWHRYRARGMGGHKQPTLRRAIGARLRQLRLRAGISSQEALTNKAGVHRAYVGRLEREESGQVRLRLTSPT